MSDVSIIKTDAGFLLQGNVNFENAVLLRDAGIHVISEKKHCVIDLAQMQNNNAVSLVVLLAWLRVARMQKITLQLIHANVALRSMVEVFGLKQVISL